MSNSNKRKKKPHWTEQFDFNEIYIPTEEEYEEVERQARLSDTLYTIKEYIFSYIRSSLRDQRFTITQIDNKDFFKKIESGISTDILLRVKPLVENLFLNSGVNIKEIDSHIIEMINDYLFPKEQYEISYEEES